jgi:hypothetical protein
VQPALAGFHHKQITALCPSPPAKLNKTSIRANPLVFGLCGIYSSSLADELEYIYTFIGLFSVYINPLDRSENELVEIEAKTNLV